MMGRQRKSWKFLMYAVLFITYCILYIACMAMAMVVVAVNRARESIGKVER